LLNKYANFTCLVNFNIILTLINVNKI